MRTAKYLFFVILLLLVCGYSSGCSGVLGINGSTTAPAATTSMPKPSEVASIPSSESFDDSEFPPSDWPETPIVTYEEDDGKLFYIEGIYSDRFWTKEGIDFLGQPNQVPTKETPAVPDKETAVAIATAIFKVQTAIDWETEDMVTDGAFYDTRDGVWIVAFSDPNVVGYAPGTITIVLRKDNAQVLAIWAEAG